MSVDSQQDWNSKIKALSRRINFGFWLDTVLSLLIAWHLLFIPIALAGRKYGLSLVQLSGGYAVGWLLAGSIAFGISRKRFFQNSNARIWLEQHLQLNNRLTSAVYGVGDWPECPSKIKDGLKWNYSRPFITLSISLFALALAFWLPLSPDATSAIPIVREKPESLAELEQWVENLKKSELIEPEAVESLQEQVDRLLKQTPQEWYSHDSLEASETLQAQTRQAMENLHQGLQAADRAMTSLQSFDASVSASQLKEWNAQKNQATASLQMGSLPLNSQLMQQFQQMDPNQLHALSSQQMAELQKQLQQGQQLCENSLGSDGEKKLNLSTQSSSAGEGNGQVARGPGSVPLTLNEKSSHAGPGKSELLSNTDVSRSTLGEVLTISRAAPQVNPSTTAQATLGGGASSYGEGGETVFHQPLTSEEQEILKRYFQ